MNEVSGRQAGCFTSAWLVCSIIFYHIYFTLMYSGTTDKAVRSFALCDFITVIIITIAMRRTRLSSFQKAGWMWILLLSCPKSLSTLEGTDSLPERSSCSTLTPPQHCLAIPQMPTHLWTPTCFSQIQLRHVFLFFVAGKGHWPGWEVKDVMSPESCCLNGDHHYVPIWNFLL